MNKHSFRQTFNRLLKGCGHGRGHGKLCPCSFIMHLKRGCPQTFVLRHPRCCIGTRPIIVKKRTYPNKSEIKAKEKEIYQHLLILSSPTSTLRPCRESFFVEFYYLRLSISTLQYKKQQMTHEQTRPDQALSGSIEDHRKQLSASPKPAMRIVRNN